jgi:hypothetical protein
MLTPQHYVTKDDGSLIGEVDSIFGDQPYSGATDDGGIFREQLDGLGLNSFNFIDQYDDKYGIMQRADRLKEDFNKLRDNKGFDFDIRNRELQYNRPLGRGNLEFSVNPNQAGIMYSLGMGA